MNPITEEQVGLLADAVRRRHRSSGRPQQDLDALERHSFHVMALVDDLAEGESLNGVAYQILRVAATLHDAEAARARPAAAAEASAALAAEMLAGIGAEPVFADAVVRAVRRNVQTRAPAGDAGQTAGDEPRTWPERLLYDACLLAQVLETDPQAAAAQGLSAARTYAGVARDLTDAAATLHSATARRIAAEAVAEVHRLAATAPVS